ncbi:MAG: hypothetical protein Q8M96_19225, partial [Rubrivivax sp.]|nr:hypothetical protein [Rubrivivax sp.]
TQKTNQFNLSTKRYDEAQLKQMLQEEDWWVADFSLADVFGDSGVVGLALVQLRAPGLAHIDTFLMSCRVIGRTAEDAFLNTLLRRLAERGVETVTAEYIATAKNDLVKSFLPDRGFQPAEAGQFQRDLLRAPPQAETEFPIQILMAQPPKVRQ